MSPDVIPVQINKIYDKRLTYTDYSGTGCSEYIPTVELVMLTRHEKMEVKLENYPWLKNRYDKKENSSIGERIAAILDEEGDILVFGESKKSLMSFEEENL